MRSRPHLGCKQLVVSPWDVHLQEHAEFEFAARPSLTSKDVAVHFLVRSERFSPPHLQ